MEHAPREQDRIPSILAIVSAFSDNCRKARKVSPIEIETMKIFSTASLIIDPKLPVA